MRGTRSVTLLAVAAIVIAAAARGASHPQPMGVSKHTIVADRFVYEPSRIVVNAGDAVTITLIATDRPYTFTIDAYRISRRATPGKNAVIEFCADQTGTFVYYCNLTDDERCRGMKGELVVRGSTRTAESPALFRSFVDLAR
jgi:plastocyanin